MATKKELEAKIAELQSELEAIVRDPKTMESFMTFMAVKGRIQFEDALYDELKKKPVSLHDLIKPKPDFPKGCYIVEHDDNICSSLVFSKEDAEYITNPDNAIKITPLKDKP
jgi:hypothetical protein